MQALLVPKYACQFCYCFYTVYIANGVATFTHADLTQYPKYPAPINCPDKLKTFTVAVSTLLVTATQQ